MRRLGCVLLCLPLCMSLAPHHKQARSAPPVSDVPLDTSKPLPSPEEFADLAATDPIAMLEAGLQRYRAEVQGYRCTLVKRERLHGRLKPEEVVTAAFREAPFSVLMHWQSGAGDGDASLYVEGENDGQMLVRPMASWKRMLVGGYVSIDPDDPRVLDSSRYTIRHFGIARGMERSYASWKHARDAGMLHVEYLGLRSLPEAGDRLCHVWQRHCTHPEEEGLTQSQIAIDAETWLQLSSYLWAGEELIGSYHFREVDLNPTFQAGEFSPAALE
jgi:hypothetical protein